MFILITKQVHKALDNVRRAYSKVPLGSSQSAKTEMRVLNVAEKNDAAKNIAALLSRGASRMREGYSKYNKIYDFDYNVFGHNCKMVMTSVAGHLLGYDFPIAFRAWNSCPPGSLFDAPLFKQCPPDYLNIKRTLEREVKSCVKLIIWTDCDREGENIGFEVIQVCTDVKPTIEIYRAKFSEITRASVERALRTLAPPNKNISDAVDVRQQLDLRIGAAFTRFQTLHLKRVFPDALGENLVSYGSCQFPTLGFVVERFKAIADFIPESFWKLKVTHTKDNLTVEFNWKRVRLFEELACQVLYDTCKENPTATVESVQSKPKSKWRPKPLDTVELEKLASRKLHINAKETMKIAEKLYTQGLISYPRTETNMFPKELDLVPLVRCQTEDPFWGEFAERVLQDGPNPFQGNKSDQAHPPIHPTKYSGQLFGNEQKIYDFIVRHFLACLSKHAEGLETTVEADIAGEKFVAKGLMIIARNYLDVYPYEKWNAKEVHVYQQGDTFVPEIEMAEGETSPPDLLTEADLIALMEKHGIGTDATHAEHIETIKARLYVGLKDNQHFVPRTLGMGLVEGYDSMGFEMSKPHLRAELEADLKRICDGLKQPEVVLREQVLKYKEVFESAVRQVARLDSAIQNYLHVQARPLNPGEEQEVVPQMEKVLKCPKCGLDMVLRTKKENTGKFLSCVGYPACREAMWFPTMVQDVTRTLDTCQTCGPDTRLLKFKFERGSCYLPSPYVGCVGGCDTNLMEILNITRRNFQGRREIAEPIRINPAARINDSTNDSGFESFNSVSTSSQRPRPRAPNQQRNTDDTLVKCKCDKPAIRLTTKKPGPNLGRQFDKCDSVQGGASCDFFQWVDNEGNASSTFTRIGGEDNRDGRENRDVRTGPRRNQPDENMETNCYCAVPSKRMVVMKEGPNKGKSFYSCSKPMGSADRCGFFQWADDGSNGGGQRPGGPGGPGGFGAPGGSRESRPWNNGDGGSYKKKPFTQKNTQQPQTKKRKCGLCGQEGHNRKNCPSR